MEEQDTTLLQLCTYDEKTPFEPNQNDFRMRNGKGRNNRLQFVVELLQKKAAALRKEHVVNWSDDEWEDRASRRKLRVTEEDLVETLEVCSKTDPAITFAEPTAEELELVERKKRLVVRSERGSFPKDFPKKSGRKQTHHDTSNFPNVNFSKDFEEQKVAKIPSQRLTRSPPYCPVVSLVLQRVPDSVLRNLKRNPSEFNQVQLPLPPPSPPEIVKRWIPSTPDSAKPSTPQSFPKFVKATPPPVYISSKRKQLPLTIASPKRKPSPQPLPVAIASPKRKPSSQPLPLAIALPKRKPSLQPLPVAIASPKLKRKPSPQPLPQAIALPKRKPSLQPLPVAIASPKRKPSPQPLPMEITSPKRKRKPSPQPLPVKIASPKRKRKPSPQQLALPIASPKRKRKPSPQPLPLVIASPKRKPSPEPLPRTIASPKRQLVATPVIPLVKPKSLGLKKAKNHSRPFTDIQNSYALTPTSSLTSAFDTVAYEQFPSKTPFPGLKLTFAPIYDSYLYTPPKSKKPRTG